jgi:phosphatidylinositol 4-phosphatase
VPAGTLPVAPNGATAAMTFERFVLRTSARWHTVQPVDTAVEPDKVLFLDRRRGAQPFAVRDRVECAALADADSERVIFGLVGVLTLLVDTYLIVVDAREPAGKVLERAVFRATRLSAVPVRGAKLLKADPDVSKEDAAEEAKLAAMLGAALALPGFCFSHDVDITRSAQRRGDLLSTSRGAGAAPDFSRADLRFVWNRYVGKPLADAGITSWIVPLVLGYVDVRKGLVNGKAVELALIARRAADRPGLRYTARGADIHGNVSNFVETEQIVSHGDHFASYVQVRGSIPLLWQQEACIRYKPKAALKAVDAGGKGGLSQTAFERHYAKLFETYGPVTAVSLVDSHGSEAGMCAALAAAVDRMDDSRLHFVPWDFHAKTRGMKYEAVDEDLVARIDGDLGAYSYLLVAGGRAPAPSMRQKGVVRTNCMDSLDRTNVVQSVIAHRIMDDALRRMGVLDSSPETCTTRAFGDFESAFKHTWADHADAVSAVYAGSGALKTDYTRTGKRTAPGMFQDLVRSARRYGFNNFLDGKRQDGIDLLLGVVSLDKLTRGRRDVSLVKVAAAPLPAAQKFLPHACAACAALAASSLLAMPRWWMKLAAGAAFTAAGGLAMSLIVRDGHKHVARPVLNGTH